MRGQKFYKDIVKPDSLTPNVRKGRSDTLVSRRNECMLARYFYYAHEKHVVYEEIMRMLTAEFFLSSATISFVVQGNFEKLKALKEMEPTVYYFQNRWPHLKW